MTRAYFYTKDLAAVLRSERVCCVNEAQSDERSAAVHCIESAPRRAPSSLPACRACVCAESQGLLTTQSVKSVVLLSCSTLPKSPRVSRLVVTRTVCNFGHSWQFSAT